MMTHEELKWRQELSLEDKIEMTRERIKEWYKYWNGNIYYSFSGGKDSCVLRDLTLDMFPDVPGVFLNTGLELPDIIKFVNSKNNIIKIRPKIPFHQVIEKYGYPVVSKEVSQKIEEIRNTKSEKLRNKRLYGDEKGNGKVPEKWKFLVEAPFKISAKCCYHLKKSPVKSFEKKANLKPMVGTMATDSRLRKTNYMQNGCNNFKSKRGMSSPLGFWTTEDIWEYIHTKNIQYAKVYDMGWTQTGCSFCMFGYHMDGEDRFDRIKKYYPNIYTYCMDKLEIGKVLDYVYK